MAGSIFDTAFLLNGILIKMMKEHAVKPLPKAR
jgi:hypothetical protein